VQWNPATAASQASACNVTSINYVITANEWQLLVRNLTGKRTSGMTGQGVLKQSSELKF